MEKNNPHSKESELIVLGCMLDGHAAKVVAEGVTEDWFFDTQEKILFRSLRRVFDAGEAVDMVTVLPVLQAEAAKDRITQDLNTAEVLCNLPPYSISWMAALKNVHLKFKQRDMIRASRLMLEALQAPLASLDELKEVVQSPLSTISTISLSDNDKTATEEIDAFISQKEAEMRGEVERVPFEYQLLTGLPYLDEVFGKIDVRKKDNNLVIGAPSSKGKSSLMRQIGYINLKEHSDWIMVGFLLESAKEDWWHNTACSVAKIDTRQPLNTVDGKKQKKYMEVMAFLKGITDKRLFLFDSPSSIEGIATRCREVAAKCGRMDLVEIDYQQIVEGTGKGNREAEVAKISRSTQQLQKSLRCPIISGTQLNDDGKTRESRAIFNDSTRFWVMTRPEKDRAGNVQHENNKSFYQVIKQEKARNDALTTVAVNFNVAIQEFTDVK